MGIIVRGENDALIIQVGKVFLWNGTICFKELKKFEGFWIAEQTFVVDSTLYPPIIKYIGNPVMFEIVPGLSLIDDWFFREEQYFDFEKAWNEMKEKDNAK